MVGFGRTIWSRQVGETEFGLKAVPLGGYIRIEVGWNYQSSRGVDLSYFGFGICFRIGFHQLDPWRCA